MKCPHCKEELKNDNKCTSCKKDVTYYVKAIKISNSYYNIALKKAKVRDLSNAILDLKKSIQFNKENCDARNLLGLIYYENGEIVEALTQWVLSKHYKPDNELAEYYLNEIQASPTKVDSYNQSFRKFNLALQAVKGGNEDLALIHLKKVLTLNEHYLKAMHLTALIYIKQEQYVKANKILKEAQSIDVANDTTLLYMKEVNDNMPEEETKVKKRDAVYASLAPLDMYKEEKTNMATFINLIVGILIGVAIVAFLIVPSVKQESTKEYNRKVVKDSDENVSIATEMSQLKEDIDNLEDEISKKDKEIDSYKNKAKNLTLYDNLLKGAKYYISGDNEKAALEIAKIDLDKFELEDAQVLYDYIKGEVYDSVIKKYADEGRDKCNAGKLEEALVVLKKAYQLTDENETVLYFLARTLQKQGDKAQAKKYYEELIKKFPSASRSATAKKRLNEMGYQYNPQEAATESTEQEAQATPEQTGTQGEQQSATEGGEAPQE
ncbi:MAG: tetratricopeptide repeat protein [Lachnospiraceae bacterium]|nr:tetratricopeptide repeat protein [Lachnospiraceae bacterium]